MTFWEMHENLPADTNVPAYILTSVKNRCLNYLNAQIRHRRAEQDMHSTLTRRLQADVRSLWHAILTCSSPKRSAQS